MADETVHVFKRGNNRMTIFRDDTDRHTFLHLVKTAFAQFTVDAHSFVLMTNHFHFLATPRNEKALPDAMKEVGGEYTRFFNDKYQRCGTMWTGRYAAKEITDNDHALICARYIEQNPVRANIVSDPGDYEWSSYRVHAYGEPSDWLVLHPSYLALGATDAERQAAYRAVCAEPLPLETLVRVRRR